MVKKCQNCGEVVDDDAIVCPICGHEFPSVASKQEKTSSKSNTNKIIAIVAVIVVIIIVAVVASGMFSQPQSNDVTVNNSSSDVKSVDNHNDSKSSASDSQVWSSAKSDKFHRPSCEWAQKISESNKIVYDSRDKAIADGKKPCDVCNP